MRTSFFFVIVSVVGFAFLAACSKLSSENLSKVQMGMKKSQVEEILGKPTSSKEGSTLGITGTTYVYESGGSKVEIVFLNDGVISKNGEFKK